MTQKYFDKAYGITTHEGKYQLYLDWADSYDQEVEEYGYATPKRCAEALETFLPTDARILDFGCGTGLSGAALANVGFTRIDGSEINPEMIKYARSRNIYQTVFDGRIDNPFPFDAGTYSAICAVGVISSGAGPASLIDAALRALEPNGLLCFSFNDSALQDVTYPNAVKVAVKNKLAEQLFCEYGDHLPAKGVGANIYVLRRL